MLESWKDIVTSISSSSEKSKLVFSEVMDMIMTKEIRKYEESFSNSRSTLNMKSKDKNQNKDNKCDKSKSRNDMPKSKNSKNSQHQMSKKDMKCWNCGKNGHYKNECKVTKKDKDGDNKTNANVMLC